MAQPERASLAKLPSASDFSDSGMPRRYLVGWRRLTPKGLLWSVTRRRPRRGLPPAGLRRVGCRQRHPVTWMSRHC